MWRDTAVFQPKPIKNLLYIENVNLHLENYLEAYYMQ